MPTTAMETEVIEDVVRTACRAPSLHNSQPWQWVFNPPATPVIARSKSSNGHRPVRARSAHDQLRRCARPSAGSDGRGRIGHRKSTGFPIPTARIIWHRSNSPRWNF